MDYRALLLEFYYTMRGILMTMGAAVVVIGSTFAVLHARQIYMAGVQAGAQATQHAALVQARAEVRARLRAACSPWFADKRRAQDPHAPVTCNQGAIRAITGD